MHRTIVRISVALFTFALGLILSAIPSIFSRHRHPNAQRLTYIRSSCHRSREFVQSQSPMMSIESDLTGPLTLLYSSTSIDSVDPGKRHVHFLVVNASSKEVSAFNVNYGSSWRSNSDATGSGQFGYQADSRKQMVAPGESQAVTIDSDTDQTLTIWIDSADFADGSHWVDGRHPRY